MILCELAVSVFCLFKQLNLHASILSFVSKVDVCDFFSSHADVYPFVVFGQHLNAVTANTGKKKNVHASCKIVFYKCASHRVDAVRAV